MDVTIAICTRNRAASLAQTLDSIAAMTVPSAAAWELVVVNNNSSDETDSVVDRYKTELPIRREFEPRDGVSNARNRAVATAKGKYILWTDDDVLVDQDWLGTYVDAFRRWPDAVLFGGKIIPQFEEPVPPWITDTFDIISGVFAFRDFGDVPVPFTLEGRRIPFGSNYAVRADQQRLYPFNPDLGPRPGKPIYGEETEIIESILRAGGTGYWVPEAGVRHCIPQQRQTFRYINSYFAGYGRYLAYRDRDGGTPRLLGAPRWLWRRMCVDLARYYIRRINAEPSTWMANRVSCAVDRGMLEFYRQMRR